VTNLPVKDSLQRQLAEARENLRLVEEREAEYPLSTDIPLLLVKEKRRLLARIEELEQQLAAQPAALAGSGDRQIPQSANQLPHRLSGDWTRDQKLALAGVLVAIVACIGTYAAVPEIRQVLASLLILNGRATEIPVNSTEPNTPTPQPPTSTPTATPEPPTATVTPKPPTPTPTLGVGSTRVREKDSMVMVYVPGGTFEMGSTNGLGNQQPVHTVKLDGFWIDRTEVANAQYAGCVAAGVCSPPSPSSTLTRKSYYGDSQYDEYPVIYVSWDDATTYCEWVGGRLPSEAEWEYAARGTDGRIYPWGNEWDAKRCNAWESGKHDTTPVGAYLQGASPYGVLDMAGNVLEWTLSLYRPYPYQSGDGREDPHAGGNRVLRGGSWSLSRSLARVSPRYYHLPDYFGDDVGFRVVVAPV
jgi:formylglycine-generating enzyme required for sulfatase activity